MFWSEVRRRRMLNPGGPHSIAFFTRTGRCLILKQFVRPCRELTVGPFCLSILVRSINFKKKRCRRRRSSIIDIEDVGVSWVTWSRWTMREFDFSLRSKSNEVERLSPGTEDVGKEWSKMLRMGDGRWWMPTQGDPIHLSFYLNRKVFISQAVRPNM